MNNIKSLPVRQYMETMVTPDMARQWLGMNLDNRKLRSAVVQAYAEKMRNGKWLPTCEGIGFDWNNVLMNGQHRLHAVIAADTPAALLIVTGLDPDTKYVVDDGAKRNGADVISLASPGETYATAKSALINSIAAFDAGRYSSANGRPMTIDNQERERFFANDGESISRAVEAATRTYRGMGAASGTAVAFAYWILAQVADNEIVDAYFDALSTGVGIPHKKDARMAVRDTFRSWREKNKTAGGNTPQGNYVYVILRGFEKFIANEKVSGFVLSKAGAPSALPYATQVLALRRLSLAA